MDAKAMREILASEDAQVILMESIKESFLASFRGYLEGTDADLQIVADAIAFDLTEAIDLPTPERRDAVIEELLTQGQVLLETNRVRLVNASNDFFVTTLRTIAHSFSSFVSSVLPKLAPLLLV